MSKPLADRIRPKSLDEMVGQQHILGEGKILRSIIESGNIPNMIFYGPSGTGKTTVANIAAELSDKRLYKLNATNASVSDIKDIIRDSDGLLGQNGILLYLDEIQNFNKKQQQSLLEYTENGKITLIASTTENPYFYIYNAILSRSTVFEFKALQPADIEQALKRGIEILQADENAKIIGDGVLDVPQNKDIRPQKIETTPEALTHIAEMSGGDVRRALNALEIAALYSKPDKKGKITITKDFAEQCTQKRSLQYDKKGDSHYDILSALQKSIRGSDPNASLHYLARLVLADDIASICRRLMVIASEDIGLAYPMAITITKSCVDAALQLGFPEARIPLAQATVLLATAPKSNTSYVALDQAIFDIENMDTGTIPRTLQNKHFDGEGNEVKGQNYLNPHDFPNRYIEQQYLPDNIKDKKYYVFGGNKAETAAKEYWEKIKREKNQH